MMLVLHCPPLLLCSSLVVALIVSIGEPELAAQPKPPRQSISFYEKLAGAKTHTFKTVCRVDLLLYNFNRHIFCVLSYEMFTNVENVQVHS
jgi:hypothetical protein